MKRERATQPQPCSPTHGAKIAREKDICKVLDYFRYKVGTTLDCAIATGILRNSITWYIADLIDEGLLQSIGRCKDATTGYPANHYTANRSKWQKEPQQIGDIISECIENSNAPLWAGLRAYREKKGDSNEK